MTKRTRVIVILLSVVVGVPLMAYLALLVFLFLGPGIEARAAETQFESTKWKAKSLDGDAGWPTRLRMVDDLLESGVLTRASRSTVVDLLGAPDDTSYFKEWSMVYWLGPERGMVRIDSEWLVLRLDANGVVQEARLAYD